MDGASISVGVNANDEKDYLITKEKLQGNNGFGGKTIGFFGGFSLLVSNLTGPGLVSLSLVYQDSGWLTPTIALVVMMVMSTLAGVFLCEAMATLPGNESLQGRVEFTTLARFFFGRKGHIVSQIFINLALQSTNVAGIVISSQIMDTMFSNVFSHLGGCGLAIHPKVEWLCVHKASSQSESPFDGHIMIFTIGYLIVMAVIIPMGYLNLDDNIVVQIAALMFLVAVIVDWIIVFSLTGLQEKVPAATSSQVAVLGNVMFNFAFITTIPSWISEKKPSVSVHRSLWSACIVSTIAFFLVGFLGAKAFSMEDGSDILAVINSHKSTGKGGVISDHISQTLVYLFPLMVLATSIPVYSIIVRYNLLQNKVCSKLWANIFAVVFPWVVAVPFMNGALLNFLINWSSILFASVANFIIPFVVSFPACNFRLKERERLTEEQHEILREMLGHQPGQSNNPSFRRFPSASASGRNIHSTQNSARNITVSSSRKSVNTFDSQSSFNNVVADLISGNSSTSQLVPTTGSHKNMKNGNNSSYRAINGSIEEEIPTPLPPNFVALPHTTPESAKWIAWIAVVLMTAMVVGVFLLAMACDLSDWCSAGSGNTTGNSNNTASAMVKAYSIYPK